MTALHWASYLDDIEAARLLVAAGSKVGATNRYGVAPLSLACAGGDVELVRLLLDAGADPNTELPGGEPAVMTAARTGRPEVVKALLARGAPSDAPGPQGQTALLWAAADGHASVVDLLIREGADFRRPLERSGLTPLMLAARNGETDVARVLLGAGADVNAVARPGKGVAKGPRSGMGPILLAVENGHFDLALDLLGAGADPDDQRSGFTALHALTWVRKPNRGDGEDGDPSPRGSGRTGSLQFAWRWVEHGAGVNVRLEKGRSGRGVLSRRGATPFLMASATADLAYLKVLAGSGADPTIPNAERCTPLLAAAGVGTLAPTEEAGSEPEVLEVLEFLLEGGADINAVDDNGETAMHGAAYKSLPEVVRFLARHGADIGVWNRTNRWGWTPLRIAEGYRVGNFKPSPETVAALHEVMREVGVAPPAGGAPRLVDAREDYPVEAPAKPSSEGRPGR